MALTKISRGLLNTGITDSSNATAITIDSSENVLIGTTTINSGTLGSSNKFLEVAAGTASGSGTLILSRATNTNNDEVGGIRYVNANNADDDGLDADGKMIAAISARAVTTDSNAGDDSGGALTFSTKPEAGSFTERMRILSDGSIGINTSSPNQLLHVHGGRVQVTRSNDINEFGFIEQDASGNAMGIFTNGGAIRFGANGTGTEHARINQSGILTNPLKPYVLARRNGHLTGYNMTTTSSTAAIYNYVESSQSSSTGTSAFDTTTGRFTAPVAGIYLITASAYANVSIEQFWLTASNGSRHSFADVTQGVVSTSTGQVCTGTCLFYLAANESIGVHFYSSGDSSATIYDNNYHTYFRVVLLG